MRNKKLITSDTPRTFTNKRSQSIKKKGKFYIQTVGRKRNMLFDHIKLLSLTQN